jgi:hypothetical protein
MRKQQAQQPQKAAPPPTMRGRMIRIAFIVLVAFGTYYWLSPRFTLSFQKGNQAKIERLKRSGYYTIKEATEYIGYRSTSALWNMCDEGRIQCQKIGKVYLIPDSTVQRLASNKKSALSEKIEKDLKAIQEQ